MWDPAAGVTNVLRMRERERERERESNGVSEKVGYKQPPFLFM